MPATAMVGEGDIAVQVCVSVTSGQLERDVVLTLGTVDGTAIGMMW